MAEQWERRKILIWGKTRPEVSQKYREIVCTGGVFEDTRRMVRIYPIPLRFMRDRFKKYQWIEAEIARNPQDSRPESYRIRSNSIILGDTIKDWGQRADWIMRPDNMFQSVESLLGAERSHGASLGIVRPAHVMGISHHEYPTDDKEDFVARYDRATAQYGLPGEELGGRDLKPLDVPEYRFTVKFRCDDAECTAPHTMSVLDWEIDALYFGEKKRLGGKEHAVESVKAKLRTVLGQEYDTSLFLGNMAAHRHTFSIVGLWYPKKKAQRQPQPQDSKQLSLL